MTAKSVIKEKWLATAGLKNNTRQFPTDFGKNHHCQQHSTASASTTSSGTRAPPWPGQPPPAHTKMILDIYNLTLMYFGLVSVFLKAKPFHGCSWSICPGTPSPCHGDLPPPSCPSSTSKALQLLCVILRPRVCFKALFRISVSGKNIPKALTRTGVQSQRSESWWGRLHTTKTFQPKLTANQFIFCLKLLTQ